jgi:hypothetical protein
VKVDGPPPSQRLGRPQTQYATKHHEGRDPRGGALSGTPDLPRFSARRPYVQTAGALEDADHQRHTGYNALITRVNLARLGDPRDSAALTPSHCLHLCEGRGSRLNLGNRENGRMTA